MRRRAKQLAVGWILVGFFATLMDMFVWEGFSYGIMIGAALATYSFMLMVDTGWLDKTE